MFSEVSLTIATCSAAVAPGCLSTTFFARPHILLTPNAPGSFSGEGWLKLKLQGLNIMV
jgi:hypothetical protein